MTDRHLLAERLLELAIKGRLVDKYAQLLDLIREVAGSGVEVELRQYVTVQINPKVWQQLREAARD